MKGNWNLKILEIIYEDKLLNHETSSKSRKNNNDKCGIQYKSANHATNEIENKKLQHILSVNIIEILFKSVTKNHLNFIFDEISQERNVFVLIIQS